MPAPNVPVMSRTVNAPEESATSGLGTVWMTWSPHLNVMVAPGENPTPETVTGLPKKIDSAK